MRRMTINQALLLAVTIALLPIGALSVMQALSSRDHARRLIAERLHSTSVAMAAVQRENIEAARRSLHMLAQMPAVTEPKANCGEVLSRLLPVQSSIVNFSRSDAQGNVLCSGLPTPGPVSLAGRDWWQAGRTKPGFSISMPTIGQVSRRRVLVAMQPLRDAGGRFAGMVSAGVRLSWIETSLQQTSLSPDAIASLTGPDGRILASSRPTRRTGLVFAVLGEGFHIARDADGNDWIYAAAPIGNGPFYVAYAEPAQHLTSFIREQWRASLIVPALTLLLTCIAVWLGVQRMVVQWIRRLSVLAQQFGRGDYDVHPQAFADAPVEFVRLSDDMQAMARAVDARNAAIESAAATARQLAREVNHRVNNNLQLMLSLVGLQTAQTSGREAHAALAQTRARIGAMALIHRLIYAAGDRAEEGVVDLGRLIPELCRQLHNDSDAGDAVRLDCQAAPARVSIDMATPLALFIVEAVTNAYRHAFTTSRSGTVRVLLNPDGDAYMLTVIDDGAGYDAGRNAASMGTQLMHAFAGQLEGTLQIGPGTPSGVTVSLRFPLAPIARDAI